MTVKVVDSSPLVASWLSREQPDVLREVAVLVERDVLEPAEGRADRGRLVERQRRSWSS